MIHLVSDRQGVAPELRQQMALSLIKFRRLLRQHMGETHLEIGSDTDSFVLGGHAEKILKMLEADL